MSGRAWNPPADADEPIRGTIAGIVADTALGRTVGTPNTGYQEKING
jgi:hypothetical protein